MMPMPPPGGPGDQPMAPNPMKEEGQDVNPETVKKQLVQLLNKAKEVAAQNGVDFDAVLSEVVGNKIRSDAPLPRPPAPPIPR